MLVFVLDKTSKPDLSGSQAICRSGWKAPAFSEALNYIKDSKFESTLSMMLLLRPALEDEFRLIQGRM